MRSSSFGQGQIAPLDAVIAKFRSQKVVGHIPKGATVLDLGCGFNASLLQSISHSIQKGVGIDLEINKNLKNKKVSLLGGRVDGKLRLKSNSFDIVLALAVVEHVQYPQKLLKEAFRVLKPGGGFLLTTPSRSSKPLLEFLAFKLGVIDHDEIGDHKRYYEQETLKPALIKAGFNKSKIRIKNFEFGLNIFAEAIK